MLTDLRLAIRGLRRAPSLWLVAVSSLALGIGANVTVYSVAREMILDSVSAAHPDRLARLDARISAVQVRELRHAGLFQDLAFHLGLHDAIWQRAGGNHKIWEMDTSPNFFDVLGIRSSSGRLYTDRDEGQPLAVVSYSFWAKQLGGAITLRINGQLYTVVGVLPKDYRSIMGHAVAPEVYTMARADARRCYVFGRLREGFSRSQTRQALAAALPSLDMPDFARQLPAIVPVSGWAANAGTVGDDHLMFIFFVMLTGVAATLALVACANVAGLLLARRIGRQRELAIRQALGANRWQLARPLVAETLTLVMCGAAAGMVLDAWLRSRLSLIRWPTAYGIPLEFHFENDRSLAAYGLITALAALAVSSVGSRNQPIASARWNLRSAFVAVQVVVAMVLLTLGGLFTRGFLQVARENIGFDVAHTVIAAEHILPGTEHGWEWRRRLIDEVRRVPGVEEVTSTDLLPLMGEVPSAPLRRAGEPFSAARDVYTMAEGERYFTTMRIPIMRGRDFEIADRSRKPIPAVVNDTLARRLFADSDPVGSFLVRGRESGELLEIVGVAADSKMRTLGEAPAPAVYTPDFNGQLLVRVSGDPARWIEPIRLAMLAAEPMAAPDVRPMHDAVAGALFPIEVTAVFVGSFSVMGMLLALVGVYGAVSYSVSRRTREMGIRSALGATGSRLVWTALKESTIVLGGAAGVGLLLAVSAIRPLVDLMPAGIDPWDVRLFAGTMGALLAAGLTAAALPARRAGRVDPAVALREE